MSENSTVVHLAEVKKTTSSDTSSVASDTNFSRQTNSIGTTQINDSVPSYSGGGGGGDLEARILKLEHTTGSIIDTLKRLEPKIDGTHIKVNSIETNVSHTLKTVPALCMMLTIFAMGYIIPHITASASKALNQENITVPTQMRPISAPSSADNHKNSEQESNKQSSQSLVGEEKGSEEKGAE